MDLAATHLGESIKFYERKKYMSNVTHYEMT